MVVGVITQIIGCLAVIVVLFHDSVSLGLAQVSVDQDAQVAARAAAQNYQQSLDARGLTLETKRTDLQGEQRDQDVQKAYEAAALAVASNGTDIDRATFAVGDQGQVTLTATRRTQTMVADHLSWFDSLTHPKATTSFTMSEAK